MCQFRNRNTSYFYNFVKCHRCRRNGHGPVPLNNGHCFKFAMSTYTRAAHHCDHRWHSETGTLNQTTSIATAFIQINSISQKSVILRFYPRPVMAFRYCHHLRLSVCVCVCVRQSSVCPDDNLSPAQATITKIRPEVQNTLVKIPIVLGVHWPWPLRSNWT